MRLTSRTTACALALTLTLCAALPAGAQTTFSYGPYAVVGTLPPGFQLAADVPPDAVSKRWDYLGEPGPDGIRPVLQIGLYQGPPPGVTYTLQDFANSMANGLRTTYGDFIGQFAALDGNRLQLSWSGLLRRQGDIVPVRGMLVVGPVNGGFYRLDVYDAAVRAFQSLPIIERAFAGFSAMAAGPEPKAPVASEPKAPLAPVVPPAPTRDQRWAVCAESRSSDDVIAACTFLATSADESVVNRGLAFYNRGNAYSDRGDRARAIADFDEALRLNPRHHEAFNNRGIVYQGLGQHDRAIQDFTQAIQLDPAGANRYYNRGSSHFARNDNVLALQDFEQVIRLAPNDADAWYMRGACNFELRNDKVAVESWDRTLQLDPRHTLALFYRAVTHYQVGDNPRTLQDLNSLIQVEPNNARALYVRGLARRRVNDTAGGNADIVAAIKLNPDVAAEVAERGVR